MNAKLEKTLHYYKLVENQGFRNVKHMNLGMPSGYLIVQLFYILVHSKGSKKPVIALNLRLVNVFETYVDFVP